MKPEPYYEHGGITIYHGDCREVMAEMDAASVDYIITDPPYGLMQNKRGGSGEASLNLDSPAGRSRITTGGGIMGKAWDAGVPGVEFWTAALRVCKPGAMMLAFGGTRTHHRLMCAIEDAGWEIRDCLMFLYGTGFPKSLDIGKAIDKAAGAEREEVGINTSGTGSQKNSILQLGTGDKKRFGVTAPATDAARLWDGWGTALKPAWEIIICAEKPATSCGIGGTMVRSLLRKEAQLWSLLPAKVARKRFGLSPAEFAEVCAFARWGADERSSIRADLFGQMGTRQFVSVMTTCLNTVGLWSSTLAASCGLGRTSTTSMGSETITDWEILKSCLSEITPESIIRGAIRNDGWPLNASTAVRYLTAACHNIASTHELFALGSAIEKGHTSRPGAIDKACGYRPIVLAMKPLDGTFAGNAQKHGVAGLNVDGGRIGWDAESLARDTERRATGRTDITSGSFHAGGGEAAAYEGNPESPSGRWPANLILDEEAGRLLDQQSGERRCGGDGVVSAGPGYYCDRKESRAFQVYTDSGGASRFFYCAKAGKSERNAGLDRTRTVKYDLDKQHMGELSCRDVAAVLVGLLRKATSESAVKWLIGESGESIVGLCPADSLSITSTAISKITESRIFDLLTPSRIREYTAGANCETGSGGSPVGNAAPSSACRQTSTKENRAAFLHGVRRAASRMLSEIRDVGNWKPLTNCHATVKPLSLMRYLLTLLSSPTGGVVLDPFMGSGTTGVACKSAGRAFVGIDAEEAYCEIASKRIAARESQGSLFGEAGT